MADCVKFARTGGEANAVAIRMLARQQEETKSRSADIMVGMIGIYPLTLKRLFRSASYQGLPLVEFTESKDLFYI